MSEKLVKVEKFEELGPGVRVELRNCDDCAGTHRGILLEFIEMALARMPGGKVIPYSGFDFTPIPGCAPATIVIGWEVVAIKHCLVGVSDVRAGKVWRWVDFDSKSAEERAALYDVLAAEVHGGQRIDKGVPREKVREK